MGNLMSKNFYTITFPHISLSVTLNAENFVQAYLGTNLNKVTTKKMQNLDFVINIYS